MSNIEDVKHIINFLKDNEIETGHKRGVEPLEDMLKELEEEKIENREIRRKYANFRFYIREYIEKKDKKVDYTSADCIKDIKKLMEIY